MNKGGIIGVFESDVEILGRNSNEIKTTSPNDNLEDKI